MAMLTRLLPEITLPSTSKVQARQGLQPIQPMAKVDSVHFSGLHFPAFNYDAYADLLVNFSVGGVQKDDLTLFTINHIDVDDRILYVYRDLLKQGYAIGVQIVPETIQKMYDQAPQSKAIQKLDAELAKEYSHEVVFNELDNTIKGPLTALLRRDAKPGESVRLKVIAQDSDPLLEAVMKRAIEAGGIPTMRDGTNMHLKHLLFRNAQRPGQLGFVAPESGILSRHQKYFQIENFPSQSVQNRFRDKAFENTPEYRKRVATNANHPAIRQNENYYSDRMRRIEFQDSPGDGFFRTLAISPSAGLAEKTQMTPTELEHFMNEVLKLNEPNPIAWYRNLDRIVRHLAHQLNKFESLHVWRDDGRTDLTMSMAGRKVVPSSATGNALPAEIFTAPIESSLQGKFYVDLPVVMDGRHLSGITFYFQEGTVTRIDVEEGKPEDIEYFKKMILPSEGGVNAIAGFNRPGEFAIGLNRTITALLGDRLLTDDYLAEKQDVHIALGDAYTVAGGQNESTRHHDFMTRSGEGSGFHIEGWLPDQPNQAVRIYDEGRFSETFINMDQPLEKHLWPESVNEPFQVKKNRFEMV